LENLVSETFHIDENEINIDYIMNRYGQDILQLVYSYVNNKEVAEDLAQEIFIKCYKALHTYNGKSTLKTWLWRIAINHCKDFLKSWYNKNVIVSDEKSCMNKTKREMIEQVVIQKEDDYEVISAIMALPIKYREVIYLYYYEELPIKEVAFLTDVGENTVKSRLRRAKELLRTRLEDS
jgi:RNA polymerase sigma-70 factor, ECF subfamily